MDSYQQFIYYSKYSRWIDDLQRRESLEETVNRYIGFFEEHLKERCYYTLTEEEKLEIYNAIYNLEVMPSMRCLMTAGKALKKDEVAGYNCSYIAVNNPRAFDELLFILCCGTGVGFSVERQNINCLPCVADSFYDSDTVIIVPDSKIGWAKSFKELISLLYSGQIPKWDLSKIRPEGAKLKTFGGRASGPKPLDDLFKFCVRIFKEASGRKLTSVECHDICCMIASAIVSGGVRRSALISLSNLSDDRMRIVKSGNWWELEPQRALANNSAVYTDKPSSEIFLKEWLSLIESKSGERGIFNRYAANMVIPDRRKIFSENQEFGSNPCGEILLRDKEFCNLSSIICRSTDTKASLRKKARIASILGTIQSTLTKFRYISKEWEKNVSEERLLGVSLNGILDCPLVYDKKNKEFLEELKNIVIETNKEWALKLKIPESLATTCVKPEGTSSQLVNSASGIHPRYSKYYMRRVRMTKTDPVSTLLIESGIPYEEDVMFNKNYVFSFPVKSPDNAILRNEMSAIEQLELWKYIKETWAEHTVSITVFVRDSEWLDVGAWVYKNFDCITGISFLPYSDHCYKQAPYEEIDEAIYKEMLNKMPKDIDWERLKELEKEDKTTAVRELACSGGSCEMN